MDNMNTEELRAKFEAWVRFYFTYPIDADACLRWSHDKYSSRSTQWQFEAWCEGYQQCAKDMQGENERLIPEFIDFIDGIQGRDLGGADVLSWSDIANAEDLRGFLHGFKALKEPNNG